MEWPRESWGGGRAVDRRMGGWSVRICSVTAERRQRDKPWEEGGKSTSDDLGELAIQEVRLAFGTLSKACFAVYSRDGLGWKQMRSLLRRTAWTERTVFGHYAMTGKPAGRQGRATVKMQPVNREG